MIISGTRWDSKKLGTGSCIGIVNTITIISGNPFAVYNFIPAKWQSGNGNSFKTFTPWEYRIGSTICLKYFWSGKQAYFTTTTISLNVKFILCRM